MFIPIVAAIVFLVGAGGLVLSSLAPIVGDSFFNFASFCLLAGPLIFFFYVIIGLCIEFIKSASLRLVHRPTPRPLTPAILSMTDFPRDCDASARDH